MACMTQSMGSMVYGSPPENDRVRELEERVEKLEEIINKMMKSKNPSFMDFKFIKEDDKRVQGEMERKERRLNRVTSMNAMFRNDR